MRVDKKLAVWGAGLRGKGFIDYIGPENIKAIIDNNPSLTGTKYHSVPVVDFETYQKDFSEYFVVITPFEYHDIEVQMREAGVYQYFILAHNPSEIQGYGIKNIFENLPIEYDRNACNIVYGAELFGTLLYNFLVNSGCEQVHLLPHTKGEALKKYKEVYKDCSIIETLDQTGKKEGNIFVTVSAMDLDLPLEQNWKKIDAFDFSDRIAEYENRDILKFKDAEKGKRGFIVCTGPSLRMEDLDLLEKNHESCIGVNKIYLAFPKTKWRPRYYICGDRKLMCECAKEISELELENKFYADTAGEMLKKQKNLYPFHAHVNSPDTERIGFSENIAKKVYWGYTVTYAALQLACYLGWKDIYLIGVDFSYTKNINDDSNHFIKGYSANKQTNPFSMEESRINYERARRYAEEHGIRIWNATRGGKLEVFERVDFDSLFNEKIQ